jgi:hypothetical protein
MEPQLIVERHLAESKAALAPVDRQREALDRQRDDLLAEIFALRDVLARRLANGPLIPIPVRRASPANETGWAAYWLRTAPH